MRVLFVSCKICGEETPFRAAHLCAKHLGLKQMVLEDIDFVRDILREHDENTKDTGKDC